MKTRLLPPATAQDYTHAAPLPHDVQMRAASKQMVRGLMYPSKGKGETTIISMLPKKLNPPPLLKEMGQVGWGLHAKMGFSQWRFVYWLVFRVALNVISVTRWLVYINPTNLQNIFVPTATLTAAFTVGLAVIQISEMRVGDEGREMRLFISLLLVVGSWIRLLLFATKDCQVQWHGAECATHHDVIILTIKKASRKRLGGHDITLEKNRLGRSKVLDVTKDLLSHGVGSSSLKGGNALPLQRSLDLIRGIGGEVEDLPAQKTKRTPRPARICQFSIPLAAQG